MKDEEGLLEPQPALIASPLRYMELLLFEPLPVVLDDITVHVSAPAMFVAQKVLMRDSRSGRKEDKDLVSVYEACLASAPRWASERASVERAATSRETWAKWLGRVAPLSKKLFGTATGGRRRRGCASVARPARQFQRCDGLPRHHGCDEGDVRGRMTLHDARRFLRVVNDAEKPTT